jgi:hypothetical protein
MLRELFAYGSSGAAVSADRTRNKCARVVNALRIGYRTKKKTGVAYFFGADETANASDLVLLAAFEIYCQLSRPGTGSRAEPVNLCCASCDRPSKISRAVEELEAFQPTKNISLV